MAYFYARSTGGFYTDALHGTMPTDAVPITEEDYAALLAAQSAGQHLESSSTGHPIAAPPPAPTMEEIQGIRRAQALTALKSSDLTALRCLKSGVPFPEAWAAYVQALREIVDDPASGDVLPERPPYPENT